jgi:putative membrane protein
MDSTREVAKTYLVGLCMGSADAVPGVSGGTIALIAGVYARLIDAVTALTPRNGLRLLGAAVPPDGAAIRETLEDIDASFLLPLGVGILTAVILVTRALEFALDEHPAAVFGLFFGLIAASVVVLFRQVSLSETRHVVAAAGGFLFAFVLSGDLPALAGGGLTLTFLAGAIAVSAMILPGVSGSLLLLILGQYDPMVETLSEFTDQLAALATGGDLSSLGDSGTTVVVFVLGGVVGLLSIARIVDRALERDRMTTLAFLVALVAGALRAPITNVGAETGWTTGTITEFAVLAAVGAVLLYALDHYAIDVELGHEAGESATHR